jgi:hypothetical protein
VTDDELIAKIPKDGWVKRNGSSIRRLGAFSSRCPLTSITGMFYLHECLQAGVKIGLTVLEAQRVVVTADGYRWHSQYDPDLRAKLLAHCGLKEI